MYINMISKSFVHQSRRDIDLNHSTFTRRSVIEYLEMKFCQIIVLFVAIGFATTREISRPANNQPIDEHGVNDESTNVFETRKHKPYHDLFLFMGGLQSLVTFIVIKIKIVLVVATIAGFFALGFKLFSLLKYTGYFYKNDYPPIVAPPYEYSSYPGPPLSSYSSSHHDHDVYSNDWPPHGRSYARSTNKLSKSLNATEMMYSLANVDKEDCQASLMCQLDSMVSRSPFLHYYLTRHVFTGRYTAASNNYFGDCTAYSERCLGARTGRSAERRKRRSFAGRYPKDYSQIVK